MLGNLRAPEIILILVILVLLFGATKLPALAQAVGKSLKIFKKEVQPEKEGGAERAIGDVDVASSIADQPSAATPSDASTKSMS